MVWDVISRTFQTPSFKPLTLNMVGSFELRTLRFRELRGV